jgi:hypothetical protein
MTKPMLPRGWRINAQGQPEQIPYPEPGFDPMAQSIESYTEQRQQRIQEEQQQQQQQDNVK